jgi:hypothetical protein
MSIFHERPLYFLPTPKNHNHKGIWATDRQDLTRHSLHSLMFFTFVGVQKDNKML